MRPSIHLPMILTCLLPVSLAVGGELPSRFTLGQYVPDNVWMYMHFVHNPERAWIEAQWAEVFDALKNSGIDRDVTSMFVSLLSEADRAEAEATLERVTAAIKRVRWGDLIGREMVFAERIGAEPPGFDYFLLAHGTSGSAEHNMTALVSILTELSTLTDKALLTNAKQHGAEVWALAPCKENPRGPTVSVHLFRKGDIIGLSLGCGNLKGILKLMEGTSEGRPVVATPRFKQALRQVKTPEDGLMFFDVQHLLRNLDDLMNYFVDSEVRENGEVPQEVIAVKRLIELAGVVDYGAVSIETDGRREFTHSLTVFQPNSESSPVAQIFLNRKPFERFDQYVPADATSFSVTGFIDLERLYELAVDFIQKNIPGGTEKIEKWNTVLAEFGFDPQRDLFSWWSGEMVSVTVPAAVVTPMGNTTSVLMIRVKDSELADQKLGAAIDWLSTLLEDHGQMLIITPAQVNAEGFRKITVPLFPMWQPVVGANDGWLVVGSSADAINKCLDVAAGKTPSIVESERFREEGLMPTGPVHSVSFSDMSSFGREIAHVFGIIGMTGGIMTAQLPADNPEARRLKQLIQSVTRILMKLGPVLQKIDFFSSSASTCTVDGHIVRQESVLTYKPPPPPSVEGEEKSTAAAVPAH